MRKIEQTKYRSFQGDLFREEDFRNLLLVIDTPHDCPCRQPAKGSIPKSRIILGLPRKMIKKAVGAGDRFSSLPRPSILPIT